MKLLGWLSLAFIVLCIDYEAFAYGAQFFNADSDLLVAAGTIIAGIPLYLTVVALAAIVNRVISNRRKFVAPNVVDFLSK